MEFIRAMRGAKTRTGGNNQPPSSVVRGGPDHQECRTNNHHLDQQPRASLLCAEIIDPIEPLLEWPQKHCGAVGRPGMLAKNLAANSAAVFSACGSLALFFCLSGTKNHL